MEFIAFSIQGRVAHFLKAEAGVSALSYPFPPRTVILGMLGAVLGLGKDQPQMELEPASIAIAGKLPKTFWHRVKMRKEDPEYLPGLLKKGQKAPHTTKGYKATLILQEWLFEPAYTVWVALPRKYHADLATRLEQRQWHYSPCMGLSEMSAEIVYRARDQGDPLPEATHAINTVLPAECGELHTDAMYKAGLSVSSMRMPRTVTQNRVFSHAQYFMERDARPMPVKTAKAFQWQDQSIVCL